MTILVTLLIICLLWITCGIIAAGWEFAYLQGEYPNIAEMQYEEDRQWALTTVIPFGIIGLIVAIHSASYKYGWKNPFTR